MNSLNKEWKSQRYLADYMTLWWIAPLKYKPGGTLYIRQPDEGKPVIVRYPSYSITDEEIICGPFESMEIAQVAYELLN